MKENNSRCKYTTKMGNCQKMHSAMMIVLSVKEPDTIRRKDSTHMIAVTPLRGLHKTMRIPHLSCGRPSW